MSKKHLAKLKKLTGFWFNPKATEYLLGIPPYMEPPNPNKEKLRRAELKVEALKELLEALPPLAPHIPDDPYEKGVRMAQKDFRKYLNHFLQKNIDEQVSAQWALHADNLR